MDEPLQQAIIGTVALSNGKEIDHPRHLKRGLAHLRRRKAAVLVAKAHRKIRNVPPFTESGLCWRARLSKEIASATLEKNCLSCQRVIADRQEISDCLLRHDPEIRPSLQNNSLSISSDRMCPIKIWHSWIRGVSFDGTQMQ